MDPNVPTLIRPKVYLGSWMCEGNAAKLAELGITHILQVGAELHPSHQAGFTYKRLPLIDTETQDLITGLSGCLNFIEQGTYEGGVLVHCMAGVSRSASVVIAYLMWREGLSYMEARAVVQWARPFIKPNDGFVLQLTEYQQLGCDASKWTGWSWQRYQSARAAAGEAVCVSSGTAKPQILCY